MRFLLLILTLLTSNNPELVPSKQVDEIELNHYFGNDCWIVCDQLIFYNFENGIKTVEYSLVLEDGRLEDKEAWDRWTGRNIKKPEAEWELYEEKWIGYKYVPTKSNGIYTLIFYDDKTLKKVTSKIFIETFTQFNPADQYLDKRQPEQ